MLYYHSKSADDVCVDFKMQPGTPSITSVSISQHSSPDETGSLINRFQNLNANFEI